MGFCEGRHFISALVACIKPSPCSDRPGRRFGARRVGSALIVWREAPWCNHRWVGGARRHKSLISSQVACTARLALSIFKKSLWRVIVNSNPPEECETLLPPVSGKAGKTVLGVPIV